MIPKVTLFCVGVAMSSVVYTKITIFRVPSLVGVEINVTGQ